MDPYYDDLLQARVDFSACLQAWDGFGLNYVQTCHTPDYHRQPQDYGGWDTLESKAVEQILDELFGDDGLRPAILKLFLDPLHAETPAQPGAPLGPCDHRLSTGSMLRFAHGALRRTRARGDDLTMITTLYGPPGWMTRQGAFRGRDLDPAHGDHLIAYLVDWVRFLVEQEGLPLRYLSLHNEGECWRRWNPDGTSLPPELGHDYNLYWSPQQVVEYLPRVRSALDSAGLGQVGVTNGETFSWTRFQQWGYADALAASPAALGALSLATSHGFFNPYPHRWQGDHYRTGLDRLRVLKPDLRAWTTSCSWHKMDAFFTWDCWNQIYHGGVSAIIPWACCQRRAMWEGDPNPGTAVLVNGDGTWQLQSGYHFYRPFCRAGRPGTRVCATSCNEGGLFLAGFSGLGTPHPDAFVLLNTTDRDWQVPVRVTGSRNRVFEVFTTTASAPWVGGETQILDEGIVSLAVPAGGVVGAYGCA